jgi:putative colanic acid biosynthesis UDP-glucose lipid carrier transferase
VYDKEYLNQYFMVYINLYWIISALTVNFYKIYRNTKLYELIRKLILQSILLLLGYFTYFGFFREGSVVDNQTKILSLILLGVWLNKLAAFYTLRLYRTFGKNSRKIIVIGNDKSSKIVIDTVIKEKDLGYQYLGNIIKTKDENIVDETKKFALENNIDEIFCSIKSLNKLELKKITQFSIDNNILLKIIPITTDIYPKKLKTEVYGNSIQVLTPIKLPLEQVENQFVKRLFDISFSIFVILFILSWLYPILFLLIRIESKGKVLFKQNREGINGKKFLCYKFRSMYVSNKIDEGHTKKGDLRITKVGSFLRKTSLDELPQFFNVLLGHMSVVGPRPHMNEHSKKFNKEVTNYMKRKSVRPGITGLAQVSGYRGEIRTSFDIENRVRYDVFYIKNWSFLLDIKIILQTFLNVFKGEEKAY